MTAPLFHKVIKKPSDLVTKHSATVKGFINQANAKTSTASKFVKEAYGIREDLANYKTKQEILNNQSFYWERSPQRQPLFLRPTHKHPPSPNMKEPFF